jgi:hypothetical protein
MGVSRVELSQSAGNGGWRSPYDVWMTLVSILLSRTLGVDVCDVFNRCFRLR